MTSQEHVGTAAASSSNAGESKPSEWTCPGYGKIKTKARCGKCYKWRGGKRNKVSKPKNNHHHLKAPPSTTTTTVTSTITSQHKISPESATATAEQPIVTLLGYTCNHSREQGN